MLIYSFMSVAPIKSRGTVNIPSPNQVCNISVSTATCTKSKSRHFPRKILIFFWQEQYPSLRWWPGLVVARALVSIKHGCKKRFFTFFIPLTFFTFLNVFLFCQRFLFLKTFIENTIKKFEKHFWTHRNKLIGLDYILKVAGCRLRTAEQCVGSAYSDTTAVTSCSRYRQYVNSWIATN